MKRRYLGAGCAALLAAGLALVLSASPRLDGRYETRGMTVLADGTTLSSYHSIVFADEHFYAITRIGPTQVETSGTLQHRFLSGYTLEVTHSQTQGNPAALEEGLGFSLLYARHLGATLHLEQAAGCLYSPQSQQLYCQNPSH